MSLILETEKISCGQLKGKIGKRFDYLELETPSHRSLPTPAEHEACKSKAEEPKKCETKPTNQDLKK